MKAILMILFAPDTYLWASAAVMLLLTLALFRLCRRTRRRWLRLLALLFVLFGWYVLVYGTFFGISNITVRRVEFASADLPASFDGYRIVQFGDAHVGSFNGWRQPILARAIDSINAQHPDLIGRDRAPSQAVAAAQGQGLHLLRHGQSRLSALRRRRRSA